MDSKRIPSPEDWLEHDVDHLPEVDLAEEVAALDESRRRRPRLVHLVLPTRKVPLELEQRGRDGLIAVADEPIDLRGRCRIRFEPKRKIAGGVLMAEVVKARVSNGSTKVQFRYLAAWGPDEERLLNFMIGRLGQKRRCVSGLERRDHGWVYTFDQMGDREVVTTLVDRAKWLYDERSSERVKIRQSVRWSCGVVNGIGVAHNISLRGVHVAAQDKVPGIGARITIQWQLGSEVITLQSRVVWSAEGSNDPNFTGVFSVEIERVDDGARGNRWATYVKQVMLLGDKAR